MTIHKFRRAVIYRRGRDKVLRSTPYWKQLLTLMGRKKTKRVKCDIRFMTSKSGTGEEILDGYTASGFIEFGGTP